MIESDELTPEEVLANHTFNGELWMPDKLRAAQAVGSELYAALAAAVAERDEACLMRLADAREWKYAEVRLRIVQWQLERAMGLAKHGPNCKRFPCDCGLDALREVKP